MTIGRIPSVEGGIQPTIVDAKGNILTATAADTPAVLAVGNNGETLVADSSQTTGLRWGNNYGFTAGKNKIINGDFRINQRAFSSTTTNGYGFDRWALEYNGGTVTYSLQTFTPGTAPVSGYEGVNFARLVSVSQTATSHYAYLYQKIEDVRTLAGQTATISFWAKASTGTPKVSVETEQIFGTGGSPSARVRQNFGAATISTSWVRYTFTQSINSISGKTLGTNGDSNLQFNIFTSAGSDFAARTNSMGLQNTTIDIWGVQIEVGSTATDFQTATGTLAGELALCQRYYQRIYPGDSGNWFAIGMTSSTTAAWGVYYFPVQMRIAPTALEQTGTANDYAIRTSAGGTGCSSVPVFDTSTKFLIGFDFIVASGLTAGQAAFLRQNAVGTGVYLGWSAEL